MSGSLTKRQQARNERILQDLIKNVPGNNTCADCQARNPGWASWSLGIFLCMRCAALHRKLGTHISKVKSLSMDSWSNEQVENMKRTGNTASNRIYNPQNTKPLVPFDVDEADAAMERFIRQKYQNNERVQPPIRHDTGSTESDDHPPPLPPKNGNGKSSRFGFRSASSIFPMSSKAKREAAATAHLEASRQRQRTPSPPLRNKPARVFGTTVASDGTSMDDLDAKLAKLRDMGFTDEKRNATVLRGLNGNLEKAVETLVSLGEKSGPSSRSRTPLSTTAGIMIQRSQDVESVRLSNNPFDMPSPPLPPQSSQSTGTLAHAKVQDHQQISGNPYHGPRGTNPFGLAPSQSQYSLHQQYTLDQSFQNLSLDQSQPLFPNHTGGFPNRQPFQIAAAGPMPTIPQHHSPVAFDAQPQQQPTQQNQSYNPFLQQQAPQAQTFVLVDSTSSSNPYAVQQRAQTFPQQGSYYQSHPQQQTYYDTSQQIQNSQQPQRYQQLQQQNNPYLSQSQQNQQVPQPQQQYMQFQSQSQQLLPQQTGRVDKSSILALYNYPQLAPMALPDPQSSIEPSQSQDLNTQSFAGAPAPTQHQQQRSVSSPQASYASGNRNPFLGSGAGFAQGRNGNANGGQVAIDGAGINGGGRQVHGQQARHVSQESMSIDAGGWHGGQNGRHSPDAFANLSARSVR